MDFLTKAVRLVAEFRSLDPTVSAQTIAVFLEVALKEGQSQTQIGNQLGMTYSSISRNVYALSELNYRRKPGLGLVFQKENPSSYRERLVYLTDKGRTVKDTLENILK